MKFKFRLATLLRWRGDPRRAAELALAEAYRVDELLRLDINREFGDIAFEAPSAGPYFVYYLPNVGAGRSNYPKVTYPEPEATADEPGWRATGCGQPTCAARAWASLPAAAVVEIQAIDQLNSFFPMQVIATNAEMADLLAAKRPTAAFLVFAEDRSNPIKMTDDLPLRWVRRGAERAVHRRGAARRVLRVPAWRLRRASGGRRRARGVRRADAEGRRIASRRRRFKCFNTGGVDSAAQPFTRAVRVPQGKVQPSGAASMVPETAPAGDYTGTLRVAPRGLARDDDPVHVDGVRRP